MLMVDGHDDHIILVLQWFCCANVNIVLTRLRSILKCQLKTTLTCWLMACLWLKSNSLLQPM